ITLVSVVAFQGKISQTRRAPIVLDFRLVEAARFSADRADSYVSLLRNVNEDAGSDRQVPEGPRVPLATPAGDGAVPTSVYPGTPISDVAESHTPVVTVPHLTGSGLARGLQLRRGRFVLDQPGPGEVDGAVV